jgi:predicted nucleic acid-binding protein
MSLDPPKVMLDRSFLRAVADPASSMHDESVARYRTLVDEFEREEMLLVAVSTHLRDVEHGHDLPQSQRVAYFLHRNHRGVFAPVEPLYVGFQHRRAARGVENADPADALTMVMCERNNVRRIVTAADAFDGFGRCRIERVAPVGE